MNDLYRVATELYSSSLRALEQRSMTFLIVQSLLAAGYAALFSRVVRIVTLLSSCSESHFLALLFAL